MNKLADRILRAAKLDTSLYEEVEADTGATGQSMAVVVISSLAAGIGSTMHAGLPGLIIGALAALVGWYIWAYLTYLIGTRVLAEPQTHADVGQLLRTTGFSSSPGLLRVLGLIPGFTEPVFFIASIWMLVAMVIAVRQALDFHGIWRAVGVCIIGWLVQAFVIALLFFFLSPPTQRVSFLIPLRDDNPTLLGPLQSRTSAASWPDCFSYRFSANTDAACARTRSDTIPS